jgi:hypothetical protein
MNRLHLKLIAALTMVIDHVAFVFFTRTSDLYSIFRIVGRISFVLFAYMLAEGFHKTKDVKKYLLRMGLFAIIIEAFLIGYYLVSNDNMILQFNIFLTLFSGLLGLYLFYQPNQYLKILVIPIIIGAELLSFSYGAYGVLMIILFGISFNKVTNMLHLIFLNLVFINVPLLSTLGLSEYGKFPAIQWYSMMAIGFIFLYNFKPGKYRLKWFFYIFYPGHILLLYLIKILI